MNLPDLAYHILNSRLNGCQRYDFYITVNKQITMETKWNFKCTQSHLFTNTFQICQFAHKCQKSKHTTPRAGTPTQPSCHQETALDDTHRMQKNVYYNGPNRDLGEDEDIAGSVSYSVICQYLERVKICEILSISLISLVMMVILLGILEINKQGNENKITIRKLVYSILYCIV